jgi:O-antigen biosynthesis protein
MPAPVPSPAVQPDARVVVDGKFFRRRRDKFFLKAVTYGPFAPDPDHGSPFPTPAQVVRDFQSIGALHANGIRIYDVPPRWFLDLALEHELRVFIDVPWPKHLCFLDSPDLRQSALRAVRSAAATCRGHPAVFAYSVANEIPPDIVRWSGVSRVTRFLEDLLEASREADPASLHTFVSFPSTEFLDPRNVDFVSFNVFLHQRQTLEPYLARLQMLAANRPLVLSEYGIDSIREGQTAQAETLAWQTETVFRAGLAGGIVFSFTDDWHRGGRQVEDWAFGLTTRDREPKPAFAAVRQAFQQAAQFALPATPRVSVVVACYNGERTLPACLEALARLNYPDYEVILVDDGSTDNTPAIAAEFPSIRCLRQPHAGLSAARNTGIAAASGEVIAFTDADCRADEDWLRYLVADLVAGGFAGVGGPNLLPPDDSLVAAAVMVSPGGPTHVMLTDREAEHVPGCNMAFFKWALDEIGGFDPLFHTAGDDVDLCWRLQEQGFRIGFSPAGFVWHYRRATPAAYLKQQFGYGEAEALLARKHPEYFNALGGGLWRGRIYSPARFSVQLRRPVIYHGLFGSGFFQKRHAPAAAADSLVMACTSLEYHVLVNLPLLVGSTLVAWLWPVFLTTLAGSLGVCALAGLQAQLPAGKRTIWSRPLVAALFFLQPIARGYARYRWRFIVRSIRPTTFRRPVPPERWRPGRSQQVITALSEGDIDRFALLERILNRLEADGWQWKPDTGWGNADAEIFGPRWSRLRLITVAEFHEDGRQTLRCRLSVAWSLFARLVFGVLAGGIALVLDFWVVERPWLWALLSLLPLVVWRIEQEKHLVRRLVAGLVSEVMTELDLVARPADPPQPTSSVASDLSTQPNNQPAPSAPADKGSGLGSREAVVDGSPANREAV